MQYGRRVLLMEIAYITPIPNLQLRTTSDLPRLDLL